MLMSRAQTRRMLTARVMWSLITGKRLMIASNLTVLVMLWNTGMTAPRRMANKMSEPSVYIGIPLSSKPPPTGNVTNVTQKWWISTGFLNPLICKGFPGSRVWK
jgi:hypothetical protein